jgi:toxin CcdB
MKAAVPKQFEVFDNPIPPARRAFPFVVVLQSDYADAGKARVVAPAAPVDALPPFAGRLMPVVSVEGRKYAVLVPSLTTLRSSDIRAAKASLSSYRDDITAALDFLFFGI